ncbi:MAG: ABC transporter substrate-binding protein [Eubacteriales bacterium]|nr:ABC transporter substrate-binding protein [Eubacteriales bacterium]
MRSAAAAAIALCLAIAIAFALPVTAAAASESNARRAANAATSSQAAAASGSNAGRAASAATATQAAATRAANAATANQVAAKPERTKFKAVAAKGKAAGSAAAKSKTKAAANAAASEATEDESAAAEQFGPFHNDDPSRKYVMTIPYSNLNRNLLRNGVVLGWGAGIDTAKQALAVKYWKPLFKTGAVIAVNRRYVREEINDWNDLLDTEENIGITSDMPDASYLFAAMAYGLNGRKKEYAPEEAVELLKILAQRGQLRVAEQVPSIDYAAPIAICFDYQAAMAKAQDSQIELIWPAGGTLSFVRGAAYAEKPKKDSEAVGLWAARLAARSKKSLMAAGFRLTTGEGDSRFYPAKSFMKAREGQLDPDVLNTYTERYKSIYIKDVAGMLFPSSLDARASEILSFIMLMGIVFWTISLCFKSSSGIVEDVVIKVGTLCGIWTAFRMFSFMLPEAGIYKYFQYGYIIFIVILTQEILRLTIVIDHHHEPKVARNVWQRLIEAAGWVLSALVLTNKWHRLVFRGSKYSGRYISNEDLGPVYPLIVFFCVAVLALAFGLLMKKIYDKGNRVRAIFPAVITLGFFAAFFFGTTRSFSTIFTDETGTVILVALLFEEAALRAGIMTLDSVYVKIFKANPLKMMIVENNGSLKYVSQAMREELSGEPEDYEDSLKGKTKMVKDKAHDAIRAKELDRALSGRVLSRMTEQDVDALLHDMTAPRVTAGGEMYRSARIPGGAVIDYVGSVWDDPEDEEGGGL